MKVPVHMETDSLYIARVEPYRISDLNRLLADIKDKQEVEIIPIGHTVENRPLEIIRVGKKEARHRILIRC